MSYTYFSSPTTSVRLGLQSQHPSSPLLQRLIGSLTSCPWLQLVLNNEKEPDIHLLVGDPAYVTEILRKRTSPTRVWVYLLQSQETLESCYVEVLNAKADRIFATSREWRVIQRRQGLTKPVDVLPPIPLLPAEGVSREKGRERIHIPEDTTILLSMNRNAAHKRYDLLIQAFVELLLKHPQKPLFLMCICDKGPNQEHALDEQTKQKQQKQQSEQTGGYHPLFDLFARELKQRGATVADYSSRLMLSTQYDSLSDEERSLFYSIADVGVSCADGGATDLCVLDGMAHGLPHVVSDIVAHQGLCTADNSIRVDPIVRIQCGSQERRLVSASAVAQALETYVTNEPLRKAHRVATVATVATVVTVTSTNSLLKRLDLFRQERDIDSAP
jgi:glycosyltransferase involved in cell wall biosynthesis